MAHIVADRVQETTTTTGTGTLTLGGAVTGYKTFSSRMATSDTCWYCIVDSATGAWETGLGTLASSTTLARTTVVESSNSDTLVSFAAGTKNVFITAIADKTVILDSQGVIHLAAVSTPSAPATDTLSLYARKIAGRMMPKWIPPSGIDNPMQPALFGNRILMYNPSTGTTGTGSGSGFGPAWTSAGTVSHPTPVATSPAASNQMKRTRWANIVTTTNQELGIKFAAASERQFWRGNAAGLGGFFYVCRFIVELYPASTVRIWAGLTGNTSTSVAISDTVLNDTCGLWHDTTDPSTGAGAFNFVTRNTATTTKQQITLSNAIAAGNSYDFYMYAKPNDSVIYWRLDDLVNNVTYENSQTTTLPTATTFMQPQAAMSNGTANTTVTTTALGVAGLYCESDR
jgi:hypothetical protein